MRRHLEAIESPGAGRLVSPGAFAQAMRVIGKKPVSAPTRGRASIDELMKRVKAHPELAAALAAVEKG